MTNFVALFTGFPPDATSEEEIKTYIEDIIKDIEGISIGYNLENCADEIEKLVDQVTEQFDYEREEYMLTNDNSDRISDEQAEKVLTNLKSTGNVFVVFKTEQDKISCLNKENITPFRNEHKIKVVNFEGEPVDIFWENLHVDSAFQTKQMIKGGSYIILAIMIWLTFFYSPYAYYYVHLSSVPGKDVGIVEDTILGVLIALGNACMGEVVERVTRSAKFHQKNYKDVTIFVVNYIAVEINTVLDVMIALVAARGEMVALGGLKALSRNETSPGMEAAQADQIFHLLVPGTLIVPYLILPIVIYIVPYFMGLITLYYGDPISNREAEKVMSCVSVDLCAEYGDMVINTTTSMLLLFFLTDKAWPLYLALMIFPIWNYIKNKYLFLRIAKKTYFTTAHLADAVTRLWVVPTALLSAVPCYWMSRAGWIPSWSPVISVLVHITIYFVWVQLIIPLILKKQIKTDRKYQDLANKSASNYFNTNWAMVLRQIYLEKSSKIIPFVTGKEYLQDSRFQVNDEKYKK
eukprot:GHVL01038932.1.p1 GENE.GHVL01038932.1~~GHVL01038932.1.p1  ORF type:complete len:520 (+),score=78.14 GHVL01038932.1:113-1672(+)